jgi:hypothetical protein
MSIRVEHKGMEIRWSDNEDAWSCMEMGFSSPSLAKVRAKIDAFRLKERKAIKVPALLLPNYETARATPCEVIEYLGPKGRSKIETVAVMRMKHSGVSRCEEDMNSLVADTPEVRVVVERAADLVRRASELSRQADAMSKTIPRLTLADIAELVKHKEYSDE